MFLFAGTNPYESHQSINLNPFKKKGRFELLNLLLLISLQINEQLTDAETSQTTRSTPVHFIPWGAVIN